MPKVFIVEGDYLYHQLFERMGFDFISSVNGADLICFTGGEDVTPSLYGAYCHDQTYNSPERDVYESGIFHKAETLGIPCVGICRGGQFLNVMSGGAMYQHVSGHTQSHYITDSFDEEDRWVSSTHHQMMKPSENAIIIATSTDVRSKREWYEGVEFKQDVSNVGIEVVYYPETKSLCFQPHPEFSVVDEEYEEMYNYFQNLVESLRSDTLLSTYS